MRPIGGKTLTKVAAEPARVHVQRDSMVGKLCWSTRSRQETAMAEISIKEGNVVIEVHGWSKLWTLRSEIRIPLSSVNSARLEPDAVQGWWKGWRIPGTHIPGFIVAGTYYRRGGREFWDVRSGGTAVAIDLEGAKYRRLVVDVEDPEAIVELINGVAGRTA